MSYLLTQSDWIKLNEQSANLEINEKRLIERFIAKIRDDENISDLIDRRAELVYLEPSEIQQLAKNLNIDLGTLKDWAAGRIEDSEFIYRIAENLVKAGMAETKTVSNSKDEKDLLKLAEVSSGQKMLKLGSTGEEVSLIQKKLFALGFMDSEPSGKFDEETNSAVKEFQKSKGIGVDGIVGPITYAQLYGVKLEPKVTIENKDYESIAKSVIDNLEGGYYHPNMMQKDPSRFSAYSFSGETMFGLDRFAGHDLYYSTPRISNKPIDDLENIESGAYAYRSKEAEEFWKLIDSANAKKTWPWNYRGGQYENQLKGLAAKIIRPRFDEWFGQYLSRQAQEIVKNDPRLMYHFVYATWNGEDWFKKFARDISQAVLKGTTDPNILVRIAIDSRTKEGREDGSSPNPIIAQSGKKIEKMFGLA